MVRLARSLSFKRKTMRIERALWKQMTSTAGSHTPQRHSGARVTTVTVLTRFLSARTLEGRSEDRISLAKDEGRNVSSGAVRTIVYEDTLAAMHEDSRKRRGGRGEERTRKEGRKREGRRKEKEKGEREEGRRKG